MLAMKNFWSSYPIQKLWSYARLRLFTILILWAVAGMALRAFDALVDSLSEGPVSHLKMLSLGLFADYRLLVLLSVAVLVIAGISTLLLANISADDRDRDAVLNFIERLWDEVSSAATHAGSAIMAAEIFSSVDVWEGKLGVAWRWAVIVLYFASGYLAYRRERAGEPIAQGAPIVLPTPQAAISAASDMTRPPGAAVASASAALPGTSSAPTPPPSLDSE